MTAHHHTGSPARASYVLAHVRKCRRSNHGSDSGVARHGSIGNDCGSRNRRRVEPEGDDDGLAGQPRRVQPLRPSAAGSASTASSIVTTGASRHGAGTGEPDDTTTPRPSGAGPGTGMPPNLRGGCHEPTRHLADASSAIVPDAIFDDPRLAQVYDPLDPDRSDLDVYVAIVDELGARSVLDIGCGTGTFACLLARRGIEVTGVDPAAASLDVARGKPGADAVRWVHGDATTLPALQVDAAFMTANVAQVFLTDEAWAATLRAAHRALRPGGWLVFETRDPARRAWEQWTPALTHTVVDIPGTGPVESWEEVLDVSGDLVTFRSMTVVPARRRRRSSRCRRCASGPGARSRRRWRPPGSTSPRSVTRPTGRAASSCSWPGAASPR